MVSPALCELLEAHYDLGGIRSDRVLEGGYWNRVLGIETGRGSQVLRISRPAVTVEEVEYEHALMRHMAGWVPQVPAPVAARDGPTCFRCEGRVVCLFPFMPGRIADRERAAVREEAARVLARIHQAGLQYPDHSPRPGYPPLANLDWDQNRMWTWSEVCALLVGFVEGQGALGRPWNEAEATGLRKIAEHLPEIERERVRFRDWVAQLASSGRPLQFAPIHGDYYRGNLLAGGDRITAVLDWEECQPEWLALELGRATWEFCKRKALDALDPGRASAFLHAYQEAGGPVPATEFDLLLPFARCVRLIEVLFALGEALRGEDWDAEYTLHNLRSLENLRRVEWPA
jgi:Ser/Thr protein kinase RdoA (MazF antagonist)